MAEEKKVAEEKKEKKAPAKEKKAETVKKEVFDAKVKELEELNDRYMRTMAEYDNYRKRTARERETLFADAENTTVNSFLAVYDNLERALLTETSDEAYKKGVEMIFNGFNEVLEKLKVEVINPVNEPFNPEFHNAVMHIDDENFGENTVAEVFQKGFVRAGRVIRYAIVKVAN